MTFESVTVNPAVAAGKPCIRDLRFPVSRLLGLLAAGESRETILRAYPYLESADVDEALRYAACLAEDETDSIASAETALLSEPALADGWDRPEEDAAWSHLQRTS